jgi:pimeloyl-ACP methyl ester carboxylesterase
MFIRSCLSALFLLFNAVVVAQVDTSLIYNPRAPFGSLDIRIATSTNRFYFLEEDNGYNSNTYLDMTAWDSESYRQGNMRERNGSKDSFVMNYRMLVPQNYDPAFADGYPLVILLHGSLERGNCAENNCYHADRNYSPASNVPPAPDDMDHELLNNDYNLVHGGFNYLEAHQRSGASLPNDPNLPANAYPGFVVVPQNLNGWDEHAAEDAIRLVRLLIKKYNIDKNRIYVNGVSNGGHGTYEVMKRAPWLFSAAVLFSAADDASITSQNLAASISRIPMWIFQGAKDLHPAPSETERYIKVFREAGANVRYTLYPNLAHGTWNTAFMEPDFFSWMLRQNKRNVHLFASNALICRTTGQGARLLLPDGYAAYQWELNGDILLNVDNEMEALAPGTYRARFSESKHPEEGDWNAWSDPVEISEKIPTTANITQRGTLLLRDLNGNRDAQLEADPGFVYYSWYKDGKLLNLPGNADVSVASLVIKPTSGNGAYTVRVAGYDKCPSLPSMEKQIVFNDQAPLSITSPSAFRGTITSPSSITLSWNDESSDETGFEVWRRTKSSNGELSDWSMVALVPADVTTLHNTGILPETGYHYKIRAVNRTSRSAYNPGETNQVVSLTTAPDNEQPSTPHSLSVEMTGVGTARLNWRAATDNSAIREYIILINEDSITTSTADTVFILRSLQVNTMYNLKIIAVDLGGNKSTPSSAVVLSTQISGLFYEHSTGAWSDLHSIDWSSPEFSGTVKDFNLSPKTQEDYFNMKFDGYLMIDNEGVYQFRTSSDDGSRLSLNDTLIVNNDGIHNFNTVTGPIQILGSGPHRITVEFFDNTAADNLLVEYKGPDTNNEWTTIPETALTSGVITSADPATEHVFSFDVFPNPASSEDVSIHFESEIAKPIMIEISDAVGKSISKISIDSPASSYRIAAGGTLRPGLYVVTIVQGQRNATRRLLIL